MFVGEEEQKEKYSFMLLCSALVEQVVFTHFVSEPNEELVEHYALVPCCTL